MTNGSGTGSGSDSGSGSDPDLAPTRIWPRPGSGSDPDLALAPVLLFTSVTFKTAKKNFLQFLKFHFQCYFSVFLGCLLNYNLLLSPFVYAFSVEYLAIFCFLATSVFVFRCTPAWFPCWSSRLWRRGSTSSTARSSCWTSTQVWWYILLEIVWFKKIHSWKLSWYVREFFPTCLNIFYMTSVDPCNGSLLKTLRYVVGTLVRSSGFCHSRHG